jgi:hypothetical protein
MTQQRTKNFYLPLARQHVRRGRDWGAMAGTDYWLNHQPTDDIYGAESATDPSEAFVLPVFGWIATSMANTAGAGADFGGGVFTPGVDDPTHGSFADPASPNHVLTNASGDLLGSPAIFGDAYHMWQAAKMLGKRTLPRFLIAEFAAAFTVASADEVTSAIGFFEDDATISTEADQYAVIYSDGVNFKLAGNAAAMATGPLIATTWALWKIVLEFKGATGPSCYAYRNGVIFSRTAGVGVQDEFPLRFGLHSLTTNRQGLGPLHIYYDY